jgi:hypothetical protein
MAVSEGSHKIWVDLGRVGGGGGSEVRMRPGMAYGRMFGRVVFEGRSRGRGSRVSSQGFSCWENDGRGTIPSTSRIELLEASIVQIVLGATTPIQTYTVVARLALSFAVQTTRFLFAATPMLIFTLSTQANGEAGSYKIPFYFSRLTRPTGRIS